MEEQTQLNPVDQILSELESLREEVKKLDLLQQEVERQSLEIALLKAGSAIPYSSSSAVEEPASGVTTIGKGTFLGGTRRRWLRSLALASLAVGAGTSLAALSPGKAEARVITDARSNPKIGAAILPAGLTLSTDYNSPGYNIGVLASNDINLGVNDLANSNQGAVVGISQNSPGINGYSYNNYGVKGYGAAAGVQGYSPGGYGVSGTADYGFGLYGQSFSGKGVFGTSNSGNGVQAIGQSNGFSGTALYAKADSPSGIAIWADSNSNDSTLVVGNANTAGLLFEGFAGTNPSPVIVFDAKGHGAFRVGGLDGISNRATIAGVYGTNTAGGKAALFDGPVQVTGTLTKPGGSFKIDHPLDPANKYLSHSFVESQDMMNIYNGVAVLDSKGEAAVTLPAWFETLNRDFRYGLTPIGKASPDLFIAQKVTNNSFKIAGGVPGLEVSWQLTGIRQDKWANAHRIPVEEEKSKEEKDLYLHPTLYGESEYKQVGPKPPPASPVPPTPSKPPVP